MRKEKLEIKKLGINGEGIGYINKKICFVNNALPGEVVEVEIIEDNRKFLKGKVKQYIQKSKERAESFCKEDKNCQGCTLLALPYQKQLVYKKNLLKDAIKKHTELDVNEMPIQNVYASPKQRGYRQVVALPVTYFNGKVVFGIYQRESKYLTFMDRCGMQDELINQCLQQIQDILNKHGVRDYNDKVKKGLRFMRLKNIDGQIQIVFITGENGIKQEVVDDIAKIDCVKSVYMSINTSRYQEFEKQGYTKLYGLSRMSYTYQGQQFLYSVKSEFPVNPEMEKYKLDTIRSLIDGSGSVLSLYCGIGLLESTLDNPEVVGVDDKNYHIKDANENAKFLRRNNVRFVCGGINEVMIRECKKKKFDYVVIRNEELTNAMKQSLILSKVENVIYVSDHPSAIAKDIEEMKKYYQVEKMIPLDTYPYSSKMETIVYLTRKSSRV